MGDLKMTSELLLLHPDQELPWTHRWGPERPGGRWIVSVATGHVTRAELHEEAALADVDDLLHRLRELEFGRSIVPSAEEIDAKLLDLDRDALIDRLTGILETEQAGADDDGITDYEREKRRQRWDRLTELGAWPKRPR